MFVSGWLPEEGNSLCSVENREILVHHLATLLSLLVQPAHHDILNTSR